MKNLKFGGFCLGLILVIVAAVSSLSAQTRMPFDFAQGRQVEPQERAFAVLDGRGAQLGVMVSDVEAKATTGGVKIDEVHPSSPAEKAGIKSGDVVVEYDGERVRSARQFTRLIQETPEGRTVKIALLRDGKRQTVDATPETSTPMTWNFGPDVDRAFREAERGLRNMPDFDFRFDDRDRDRREPRRFEYRLPGGMATPMPFFNASRGRLGVSVQSLTPELEEYFGAKNGGALVSSVTRESAASKAGVKAGDVITSVNGKRVEDADDLQREIEDAKGEVTIVVVRDKKDVTLKATIDEPRERGLSPQVIRPGSRPGV